MLVPKNSHTHAQALFGKMVDKTPVPAAIDPDKPLDVAGRRRMIHQRRAEEAEKPSEASAFSKAFGTSIFCMRRRVRAIQR
jgi:hypothetical protein